MSHKKKTYKPQPPTAAPLPSVNKAKVAKACAIFALRNIVAGVLGLIVFTIVVNYNESYHWLWYKFTKNNLNSMRQERNMTNDERMVRKLGVDYSYILTVKTLTPENAVVYIPSKDDFLAPPTHGDKLPFKGTMVDKLSAVRVLYPRRVVKREELGKTSYARNMTHIAIVNGLHRDMVSYPTDTTSTVDVLPTNPNDYVPF